MTTAEGGMVITNNKSLSEKLSLKKLELINHLMKGKFRIYDAIELGFNYRMSEIHAAIGLEQLKKPQNLSVRKKF